MPPANRVELLLHPVRLRVVQALLGDRRLTTAALREELDDVAPATLYRQVATLAEAGVLDVVEEQRVRGAVERTYALRLPAAQVPPEEIAAMSADEHRQAFTAFVAGLLADFDRYLAAGSADLVGDRVGYRQAGLYLDDEELDAMLADLRDVIAARMGNEPSPGRRRRLLSTVVMPAPGTR